MFGQTKKRLQALEIVVQRLVDKLDNPIQNHPSPDVVTAFASLLGKQIEGQGSLVTAMGEIAVKAAARRAGIKGGNRRAETSERGRNGRFLPGKRVSENRCPLCVNPMHRPVSIEMIQRHRQHEMQGQSYGVSTQESDEIRPSEPDAQQPARSESSGS